MSKNKILTRNKKRKAEELFSRGEFAEAHAICNRVCQTDRNDADAWVLLAVLERRLGRFPEAVAAARHATALAPNAAPAHQALAMALQCQGQLDAAIASYRTALQLRPDEAELHYHLANALREIGALTEADASYARALALRHDFLQALSNRGALLVSLARTEEAKHHLLKANQLDPGRPQVLCNLALVLQSEGRFDEAKAYCREILARHPDFLDAIALLAELHEKSHETEETRYLLEHGLTIAPDNTSLNLTAARFARNEGRTDEGIARLESLRARLPEALQGDILMLLGQLYDKQKDSARAYACLNEGNLIKARTMLPGQGDQDHYLRRIEQIRTGFRADPAGDWRPVANDDFTDNPIFLIGFPRSGTTLLEQILDAHPRLQALEEKPLVTTLENHFHELTAGRARPFADLSLDDLRQLRKTYFDTAARHLHRDPERILVDKFPLNAVQAHLIWRVFPKAKIILAIRHPCDVCFSCFMQNFTLNEAMATFTSLQKTAETYAGVMSLWREFVDVLPIDYQRIRYEDLVADKAGETRRLLDFLELDWDEKVLRHDEHARTRSIRTPSYHQVSQPIYQDAKYRWKRYEECMAPILPILQPYIDYFDYAEKTS